MTLSLYSLKLTSRRPARRQFPRKQPRFRKRFIQTYNALGNITSKTGVGAYTYHATKLHAVVAAKNKRKKQGVTSCIMMFSA